MPILGRSLGFRAATAGVAAAAAVVWGGSGSVIAPGRVAVAADAPRVDAPWPVGVPQPISVVDGRARFVAPSRSASDRTLVVVSALTRTPGNHPVRIVARPAPRSDAPILANDGRAREPAAPPPVPIIVARPALADPPEFRTFHLPVRDGDPASPSNYAAVRARLRAFSPTVQVYVDPADFDRIDDATIRDAVDTFDDRIRPAARDRIGLAEDADHDGRFAILFSGWLGHLADGKLAVDGYVRGADLEPSQAPPIGNRADVMYLNAAMRSGPHLRTVMAHEYTHAVTYGRKALGPAHRDEEGWLDEGLAHLSEDLHGFSRTNLDYRVAAFLSAPERFRLLVEDFGSADTIRSHGHRGAAYLFLRWCADHHGPDLFGRLVRSERRGVANIEAETGRSFAWLYRALSVDLFLAAITPGSPAESVPPRASRIVPDGSEDVATLNATTTHYAIIEGSKSGAVEVEVEGPPGASLQVTAVPLPRDYPAIDLIAGIETTAEGGKGLVARIRERDGQPITITSVNWAMPDGRLGGSIEGEALRTAFEGDRVATGEVLTSRPIPIGGGCWTVCVIGTDSLGRKVVTRAEVGRSETAATDGGSRLHRR